MTDELDIMQDACPTRQVLARIADKWTMLVILALTDGTLRFSRLRARIGGVTQKMLTQTLRGLERDGMVSRRVFATVPVTVEYRLTPLGHSLAEAVSVIRDWTYQSMTEIQLARTRFDAASPDCSPTLSDNRPPAQRSRRSRSSGMAVAPSIAGMPACAQDRSEESA
jgi:DNA-binding HxlR family transcriptional regulator